MVQGFMFAHYLPLLSAVGAFIIAYAVMPRIIRISHSKQLFDDPTDDRKLHFSSIPNLGGAGIFFAVMVVFLISGYAHQVWAPYMAAGLTMLFFSGMKDDISLIDPYKKLFVQVAAAVALIAGGNMVLTDMGGVFGVSEIPYWAGFGLTLFTMIVVINAYNLIDGIDGLAGGIGVIAALFFGGWFWHVEMLAHAILAASTAGALLAFLKYNFQPASIFMGDTGSQIVGYVLGFLAVSLVQAAASAPVEVPFQESVPVLVLSVLIVPLYDTLRVFIMRVVRGDSPFTADRRHVHHQLVDLGFSHRGACYILYTYTLGIIGLTLGLSGMGINALLGVVLLTTVLLFPTMRFKRRALAKMGIDIPTRRQIQVFEMKYGTPPKAGNPKQNGHHYPEQEPVPDQEKKEELEEVAV